VTEDFYRYSKNDKELSSKLKEIRHLCKIPNYKDYLQYRDSINDILKTSTKNEQTRNSIEDILIANFKRAQESARVLEELFKLED